MHHYYLYLYLYLFLPVSFIHISSDGLGIQMLKNFTPTVSPYAQPLPYQILKAFIPHGISVRPPSGIQMLKAFTPTVTLAMLCLLRRALLEQSVYSTSPIKKYVYRLAELNQLFNRVALVPKRPGTKLEDT